MNENRFEEIKKILETTENPYFINRNVIKDIATKDYCDVFVAAEKFNLTGAGGSYDQQNEFLRLLNEICLNDLCAM